MIAEKQLIGFCGNVQYFFIKTATGTEIKSEEGF